MISPLMVSSKNVKVSQKYCLGNSIENVSCSSPSEQIIIAVKRKYFGCWLLFVLATGHSLLRMFFKYLGSNLVSGRPA